MDTWLAVASKRELREYDERPIPEEAVRRILDAGRLAGSSRNTQPWRFLVVEDEERRRRLAQTVHGPRNVLTAALVVALAAKYGFDAGRCAQNMMLAAWNEGVGSCPNRPPDAEAAAQALGLDPGEEVGMVLTFGYPRRPRDPSRRTAEEWSARADRKSLDELVERL